MCFQGMCFLGLLWALWQVSDRAEFLSHAPRTRLDDHALYRSVSGHDGHQMLGSLLKLAEASFQLSRVDSSLLMDRSVPV